MSPDKAQFRSEAVPFTFMLNESQNRDDVTPSNDVYRPAKRRRTDYSTENESIDKVETTETQEEFSAHLETGKLHYKLFEETGSIDDLDQAFNAIGEACHTTVKAAPDQAFAFQQEHSEVLRTLQHRIEIFIREISNGYDPERSMKGAPQGETIYANTPQHHKPGAPPQKSEGFRMAVDTVEDKPYNNVELLAECKIE